MYKNITRKAKNAICGLLNKQNRSKYLKKSI